MANGESGSWLRHEPAWKGVLTTMKIGFDNQKYLKMQSEHIRERISQFGDKLYLEFGGKLFDDYHASRVLPGFAPDSKLNMLLQLADQALLKGDKDSLMPYLQSASGMYKFAELIRWPLRIMKIFIQFLNCFLELFMFLMMFATIRIFGHDPGRSHNVPRSRGSPSLSGWLMQSSSRLLLHRSDGSRHLPF